MRPGEELVVEPFQRLIEAGELVAFRHRGFWASMDTLRDKQTARGHAGEGPDALAALDHGAAPRHEAADLARPGEPLRLLCLGAHADDIEIGCGATILDLIDSRRRGSRSLGACCRPTPARAAEAKASAAAFLEGAAAAHVDVQAFRDGHFPWQGSAIKEWFERLKALPRPGPDPDPHP